jgi:hypothetical protein
MQDAVDPAVAGAGEPVPTLVTGGGLERGSAVPGRDVRRGAEPADVCDIADQTGSAGQAYPVQTGQGAAVLGDELAQLPIGCPDLGVDRGEFLDELSGQVVAGLGHDVVRRRCGAQQIAGSTGQLS